MLLPVVFGIVSVLLGALLGLWPGARASWLAPVRALAIGAGLAVVFAALLPEALEAKGAVALAPFAAGFAAPMLLERVLGHPPHVGEPGVRPAAFLGLELSYLGLLLHQVGDGLTMGAYAGPDHQAHPHFDVFLAIAGHTIPVTAAVALAFSEHRGRRSGLVRSVALAIPVLVGVGLTRVGFAEQIISANHGWVSATAAGLLLHVVLHGSHAPTPGHHHEHELEHDHDHGHDHDHEDESPGSAWRARLFEIAALAFGAGMVMLLLPGGEHEHAHLGADQLGTLAAAAVIVAALHFTLRHEAPHASCATGACERPPLRR
jgi:hypothetical protein